MDIAVRAQRRGMEQRQRNEYNVVSSGPFSTATINEVTQEEKGNWRYYPTMIRRRTPLFRPLTRWIRKNDLLVDLTTILPSSDTAVVENNSQWRNPLYVATFSFPGRCSIGTPRKGIDTQLKTRAQTDIVAAASASVVSTSISSDIAIVVVTVRRSRGRSK